MLVEVALLSVPVTNIRMHIQVMPWQFPLMHNLPASMKAFISAPPFKYEIIKLFLETNNLIIFEEFDCHNKEGSYLTSNLLKQTQFSQ